LALPLGELTAVGAWSCLLTALFLVFFLFLKPGSWGTPARLVRRGRPGIRDIATIASLAIVVLIVDFPLGVLSSFAGMTLGLWGSYVSERIRAGGNVLLLIPVVLFTLSSGVLSGGLGGTPADIQRASVVRVDPSKNAPTSSEEAILGRDGGGYWLQQCGAGRRIRYVQRDSIKMLEILKPVESRSVNLFGMMFSGERFGGFGYRRPC
jgi:hypothetical protein